MSLFLMDLLKYVFSSSNIADILEVPLFDIIMSLGDFYHVPTIISECSFMMYFWVTVSPTGGICVI